MLNLIYFYLFKDTKTDNFWAIQKIRTEVCRRVIIWNKNVFFEMKTKFYSKSFDAISFQFKIEFEISRIFKKLSTWFMKSLFRIKNILLSLNSRLTFQKGLVILLSLYGKFFYPNNLGYFVIEVLDFEYFLENALEFVDGNVDHFNRKLD